MELLLHFVKTGLYLLLFYAGYRFLLQGKTFFFLNRAYLLAALLLSVLLTFVRLPDVEPVVEASMLWELAGPDPGVAGDGQPAAPAGKISWEWVLVVVYGLGAGFAGLKLSRNLYRLVSYLKGQETLNIEGARIILREDYSGSSFSFFNWVVINRTDYEHHFDAVLRHEMVHVRQLHSLDVLLVEVFKVVFWCYPFLNWYKNSLQLLHEYLADSENAGQDAYADFLLVYAMDSPISGVTNRFFYPSFLKQRIVMMYKQKTSLWALGNYFLAALLIGVSVLTVASCDPKSTGSDNPAVDSDEMVSAAGVILDENGEALPGVNILLKGHNRGTTTNSEGRFDMGIVPKGSQLAISFAGYNGIESAPLEFRSNSVVVRLGEGDSKSVAAVTEIPAPETRDEIDGKPVFTAVEVQPEFPGGTVALFEYLAKTIRYPGAAARAKVEGRVFLQFVVTTEGEIRDVMILKGIGFGCDAEAVRAVKGMPAWKPGRQGEQLVNVRYTLPVNFELQE